MKLLPRSRQTLLFSATMPRPIALLAEDYLENPVKVVVAPPATMVERIDRRVVFVPSDRKRDVLVTMLRDPAFARVLVFTRVERRESSNPSRNASGMPVPHARKESRRKSRTPDRRGAPGLGTIMRDDFNL